MQNHLTFANKNYVEMDCGAEVSGLREEELGCSCTSVVSDSAGGPGGEEARGHSDFQVVKSHKQKVWFVSVSMWRLLWKQKLVLETQKGKGILITSS